ncbi:unnamed protein product, partial [Rotaria magnacalcarata]
MIQTISIADQQHHQFRGGLFNFFSDINQPQLTAKHGSSINTGGNTDDLNGKGTDPWLHMAKNQTGRIMQGGTDLILTPVNWLTNLTNNWPLYLVCMTIIMCLLAFFYCSCKASIAKHFIRRQSIPLPFA